MADIRTYTASATTSEKSSNGYRQEALYVVDDLLLQKDGMSYQKHPQDVYILAYIHCLPSTVSLIQSLVWQTGVLPRKIVILPKVYSLIEGAVELMKSLGVSVIEQSMCFKYGHYDEAAWEAILLACKIMREKIERNKHGANRARVILVDDGGLLTGWWSKLYRYDNIDVVSVQQTASGLWREPYSTMIPRINVAHSAAKKIFESKIIARGVAKKISAMNLFTGEERIGIAGYGAVGKAVAHKYREEGRKVVVYDRVYQEKIEEREITKTESMRRMIISSDIIFGCTGRNWYPVEVCRMIGGKKIYVSCSSRDVEYKGIMAELGEKIEDACDASQQFKDVEIYTDSGKATVKNGGFPVNFDRKREWESRQEIILTRALVLIGIVQAMSINTDREYKDVIMLGPNTQKYIVEKWIEDVYGRAPDKKILEEYGVTEKEFWDSEWWRQASEYINPRSNKI